MTTIIISGNKDSGSVPVKSTDLPPAFRGNGLKPSAGTLSVKVDGGPKRPVTYIMGSEAKGYHLCCKGSGPFLTGADSVYEIEIVEE